MEKEMTGIYISGHPLDDYVDTLEEMTADGVIYYSDKKKKYLLLSLL